MKCTMCGNEMTSTGDDYSSGVCFNCKWNKPPQQAPLYGWICPRCGTVHSPFVLTCGCPPPTITWTGINTSDEFKPKE